MHTLAPDLGQPQQNLSTNLGMTLQHKIAVCVTSRPKAMSYPAGHSVQKPNRDPIQIFVLLPAAYFPLNN